MKSILALVAALALAAGPSATVAGLAHGGGFSIRYNALASNALPANAVAALGLPHSARQGMVNVVVRRGKGYTAPAVNAQIGGYATTSAGARLPIRFRTIRDSNGVSYLGAFKVPGTDTLRFDLDVTPQGAATQHLHFKQSFLVP